MSKLVNGHEEPLPMAAVEGDRGLSARLRSMSRLSWSRLSWKKVWGGLLFAVGWLLSPLC